MSHRGDGVESRKMTCIIWMAPHYTTNSKHELLSVSWILLEIELVPEVCLTMGLFTDDDWMWASGYVFLQDGKSVIYTRFFSMLTFLSAYGIFQLRFRNGVIRLEHSTSFVSKTLYYVLILFKISPTLKWWKFLMSNYDKNNCWTIIPPDEKFW
jgi:hypothetical protein